jgi:hypothetical protein
VLALPLEPESLFTFTPHPPNCCTQSWRAVGRRPGLWRHVECSTQREGTRRSELRRLISLAAWAQTHAGATENMAISARVPSGACQAAALKAASQAALAAAATLQTLSLTSNRGFWAGGWLPRLASLRHLQLCSKEGGLSLHGNLAGLTQLTSIVLEAAQAVTLSEHVRCEGGAAMLSGAAQQGMAQHSMAQHIAGAQHSTAYCRPVRPHMHAASPCLALCTHARRLPAGILSCELSCIRDTLPPQLTQLAALQRLVVRRGEVSEGVLLIEHDCLTRLAGEPAPGLWLRGILQEAAVLHEAPAAVAAASPKGQQAALRIAAAFECLSVRTMSPPPQG